MFNQFYNIKLTGAFAALLLFVAGITTAVADQVSISYIDASFDSQTLSVDTNSQAAELALVAALLGEDGVAVFYDPNNGTGTLAEIGAAMATAAPTFAANIAEHLAELSRGDTQALVDAINEVPGVDTVAVLAAVHFTPNIRTTGPQTILAGSTGIDFGFGVESNPSRN